MFRGIIEYLFGNIQRRVDSMWTTMEARRIMRRHKRWCIRMQKLKDKIDRLQDKVIKLSQEQR